MPPRTDPTRRLAHVRAVWGVVTKRPQASVREIEAATGLHSRAVQDALIELDRIGYVRRTARTARSAVVVVPLISRLPAGNDLDAGAYDRARDEANDDPRL